MALLTRVQQTLGCLLVMASASILAAPEPVTGREQLNALLWQQQAVEYRAATLQAYRAATARLGALKRSGRSASVEQQRLGGFKSKKPAVVLDVDETVLDNSPFMALLLREGRGIDALDWAQWVESASAAAVPGAVEFVRLARAQGFRVVFISNRSCDPAGPFSSGGQAVDCPQKTATLRNLQNVLGYAPGPADLLMRFDQQGRDDSDKTARRMAVARTHRIAILIGDDLNDFIRGTDYNAASHAAFWGATRGPAWVALPNAVYGSWERSFPDVAQKYAALKAWVPPLLPPSAQLQVVSWNLQWMAEPQLLKDAGFWQQCAAQGFPNLKLRDDLPFCDVYKGDGILNADDYELKKLAPMRARLAEFAAQGLDVLAVQESSGPGALQAVLPAGYTVTCFTTRVDAQNLGFALRNAANLAATCQEIKSLSQEDNPAVSRPVRRGLELMLKLPAPAPKTLVLLNVHLKSSCPSGRMDSTSNFNCATLQQQAPALEAWLEAQANKALPFAIIGDWNRDLEAEIAGNFVARSDGSDPAGPLVPTTLRNLWPELNDGQPAASAMDLAEVDRSLAKTAPSCHDKLDQLVVSELLKRQLTRASLKNNHVPAALLARPQLASDHCPLGVTFLFR